jgi:hypothetical protein
MDKTLCGARVYSAGLLVLGVDRYGFTVAHTVAGFAGAAAVALWWLGVTVQPVIQRPYLRLAGVAAAVSGGAAVFQLLEQWRDPDVYSWIVAPLVLIGLQAAVAGYEMAKDAVRPPVAARMAIELLFSFAFAVGANEGQDGFVLARASAQMLAILALLGVVCLAVDAETSLAPVLVLERSMLAVLLAVISTRHVIGDETRAHAPELFQIGATACVALLLAPLALK